MKYSNRPVTINGKRCNQINRLKAKACFEMGREVYMHPANLRVDNIFQSPMLFSKATTEVESFEKLANAFEVMNCTCKETGNTAIFFTPQIHSKDKTRRATL